MQNEPHEEEEEEKKEEKRKETLRRKMTDPSISHPNPCTHTHTLLLNRAYSTDDHHHHTVHSLRRGFNDVAFSTGCVPRQKTKSRQGGTQHTHARHQSGEAGTCLCLSWSCCNPSRDASNDDRETNLTSQLTNFILRDAVRGPKPPTPRKIYMVECTSDRFFGQGGAIG